MRQGQRAYIYIIDTCTLLQQLSNFFKLQCTNISFQTRGDLDLKSKNAVRQSVQSALYYVAGNQSIQFILCGWKSALYQTEKTNRFFDFFKLEIAQKTLLYVLKSFSWTGNQSHRLHAWIKFFRLSSRFIASENQEKKNQFDKGQKSSLILCCNLNCRHFYSGCYI